MSKKNNNFMESVSVSELIGKFNFFVPEIQREYVWGYNHKGVLKTFCEDITNAKNKVYQKDSDEEIKNNKLHLLQENNFDGVKDLIKNRNDEANINIGFLYSYEPNYKMEHFPDSELFKDVYLIDGQQRMTSLFLILFYLAIKEDRIDCFKNSFRYDKDLSTIAFDYRVRTLTHTFLINLIDKVRDIESFENIKDATWYNSYYKNDSTILAMIKALEIIEEHFKDKDDMFYDFINENVFFWHFKTEKTNQGEELYITMNSRGKQLQNNEIVRAKLFEKIPENEQSKWASDWEIWQDYFWVNRGKNENADVGFNEFITCIAGLEAFKKEKQDFIATSDDIYEKHLIENLTLDIIESYFKAFGVLYKNKDAFKGEYKYCSWVDEALKEMRDILFSNKTNWFADYTNPNRGTERRRMVFVWSNLLFAQKMIGSENTDLLYRKLRIHWLRYNNNDRSVGSIVSRVNDAWNEGIWSKSYTVEEEIKHNFYIRKQNDKNFRNFESWIWKIEDHKLNLNGSDVGNINSIHLIDYQTLEEVKVLEDVYNKFTGLFPIEQKEEEYNSKINDVLMFYGFYAIRKSPYYYENYDFGNWRRIIRNIDSKQERVFATFFEEYNDNLQELLELKKEQFITENKENIDFDLKRLKSNELHDVLKLYIVLYDNIWIKGKYIAVNKHSDKPENIFSDYEEAIEDGVNTYYKTLYNTKGHFKAEASLLCRGVNDEMWKAIDTDSSSLDKEECISTAETIEQEAEMRVV